jgi:hypothetical protein
MTENLDHLNALPKRDPNHVTEEKAETAFQGRLTESSRFILQRADRKDYGTMRHLLSNGETNKIHGIYRPETYWAERERLVHHWSERPDSLRDGAPAISLRRSAA